MRVAPHHRLGRRGPGLDLGFRRIRAAGTWGQQEPNDRCQARALPQRAGAKAREHKCNVLPTTEATSPEKDRRRIQVLLGDRRARSRVLLGNNQEFGRGDDVPKVLRGSVGLERPRDSKRILVHHLCIRGLPHNMGPVTHERGARLRRGRREVVDSDEEGHGSRGDEHPQGGDGVQPRIGDRGSRRWREEDLRETGDFRPPRAQGHPEPRRTHCQSPRQLVVNERFEAEKRGSGRWR
mmetsp:Transcript_4771/g.8619  ORF Transcript_4771/g.8619 Transcript_4771/m.8619 type:complete len:237 (+) Transcript_4771:665-1375(+)